MTAPNEALGPHGEALANVFAGALTGAAASKDQADFLLMVGIGLADAVLMRVLPEAEAAQWQPWFKMIVRRALDLWAEHAASPGKAH